MSAGPSRPQPGTGTPKRPGVPGSRAWWEEQFLGHWDAGEHRSETGSGAEGPAPPEEVRHAIPSGAAAAVGGGESRLARALAESVALVAEREAFWTARTEEVRSELERRSAARSEREAALAAHEAALVARLDERGRLIDGLTAHLNALTAEREQERVALERAVADLEVRLAASQARVAELARGAELQAAELAAITAGRAWKFVRLASAARRKLVPGPAHTRARALALAADFRVTRDAG